MSNNIINMNSVLPRCSCCVPTQPLVITGQRAYCPLSERIYEQQANAIVIPTALAGNENNFTDFYPPRGKRAGEAAAISINPAEERFGA